MRLSKNTKQKTQISKMSREKLPQRGKAEILYEKSLAVRIPSDVVDGMNTFIADSQGQLEQLPFLRGAVNGIASKLTEAVAEGGLNIHVVLTKTDVDVLEALFDPEIITHGRSGRARYDFARGLSAIRGQFPRE